MRKAFYLVSFLVFLIIDGVNLYEVIFGLIILVFSKVDKKILILTLILVFLRTQMKFELQPSQVGRVIELNPASVVVVSQGVKVSVTQIDVQQIGMGDLIVFKELQKIEPTRSFFGFDGQAYALANHLTQKAQFVAIETAASPILETLSLKHAKNVAFQKWYRALMFQTSFEGLALFFSLGLIYEALIWWIRKLSSFLPQRVQDFIELVILVSLAVYLFFPLSLVRVLFSQILKRLRIKAQDRFHALILLLYFFEPYALTQLSILIPLSFMFVGTYLPRSLRIFNQYAILTTIFLSFGLRVSLLALGFYPLLRKIFPYLVLMLFFAMIFPIFQNPVVIILDLMNNLYLKVNTLWVLKGKMGLVSLSVMATLVFLSFRLKQLYLMLSLLFCLFILHPLTLIPWVSRIWMINVGQGDAFIFQSAFNREVYLLDTGNRYAYDDLKKSLDGLGITKINALIISHHDADHSANIEALNQDFKLQKIDDEGQDYVYGEDVLRHLVKPEFLDENDDSLVYALESDFTFLFLADVSKMVETHLVKLYPNLDVDVLKIAHHGSDTSSSYELLLRYQVELALISVGRNHYGHPSPLVLERLNNLNIHRFNTLADGDVMIELRKDRLTFTNAVHEKFVYFD